MNTGRLVSSPASGQSLEAGRIERLDQPRDEPLVLGRIVHQVSPLELGQGQGIGLRGAVGRFGIALAASQTLARPKSRLTRAGSAGFGGGQSSFDRLAVVVGQLAAQEHGQPRQGVAAGFVHRRVPSGSRSRRRRSRPVFSCRLPRLTCAIARSGCKRSAVSKVLGRLIELAFLLQEPAQCVVGGRHRRGRRSTIFW